MPKEICPYCNEPIEIQYGRNVPCPKCGEKMNVFDSEHPLSPVSRSSGYSMGSLTDRMETRRTRLHEGQVVSSVAQVSYKDIGGLDEVISELDLLVNGSSKYPLIWEHLGRKKTRAVLLVGPPGCGKTLLAQALASETGRKVNLIQGAEIKGWRQGASEGNLISAYEAVRPSGILIIDEVDAIGGKREQMVNEINISIVATLCSLLDGARYKDEVVIIGTTNKPHMMDNALRRPGRFDLEVYIPAPDVLGRKQIFAIHTKGMPLQNVDLDVLAKRAHGFTGADIAGVCARLNQKLFRQAVSQLREGLSQEDIMKNLFVTQEEFYQVITETVPSLLRESYIEISKVKWDDIGGLDEIKNELQKTVVWPLKYKELMLKLKMRSPKGILLYGSRGCGKTLLAKAMAGESEYNFLSVNGPALISQWMGRTEEAIRDLFWKARQARPCVIFLDELEALAPRRRGASGTEDRAVSQFLAEIDGALSLSDVFIMGTTNRPDLVDEALLRPGRLDLQYEVPLPDPAARKSIFEIHLRGTPCQNISIDKLIEPTDGKSGADIEWICTTAKKITLERYIKSKSAKDLAVTQNDLLEAVNEINKRKY